MTDWRFLPIDRIRSSTNGICDSGQVSSIMKALIAGLEFQNAFFLPASPLAGQQSASGLLLSFVYNS